MRFVKAGTVLQKISRYIVFLKFYSKFSFGKGDRRLAKHVKKTLMQLESNLYIG